MASIPRGSSDAVSEQAAASELHLPIMGGWGTLGGFCFGLGWLQQKQNWKQQEWKSAIISQRHEGVGGSVACLPLSPILVLPTYMPIHMHVGNGVCRHSCMCVVRSCLL